MNQMIKALLSGVMLTTLAACSGGGNVEAYRSSGMNAETPDEMTAPVGIMPANADLPATPANSTPLLDACPFVDTIDTPDTAGCLAGTYSGVDAFTSEVCTIRIDANGGMEASRGTLNISMNQQDMASDFSKVAYIPKANLSPVGYSIHWMATKSDDNGSDKKVLFNFNALHDEKLTIEVHHQHPSLNEMTSIICDIQR
ncbi:MAG: hypothetical protein Q4D91_08400 [Lautropia sp.]|nr:hypothetical protein [Lautropia sp.]